MCLAFHLFVAGLLLFAAIASFIGVFKAHLQEHELVFGSMSDSLSLLAFAVTLTLWLWQMKNCASDCTICGVGKKK